MIMIVLIIRREPRLPQRAAALLPAAAQALAANYCLDNSILVFIIMYMALAYLFVCYHLVVLVCLS